MMGVSSMEVRIENVNIDIFKVEQIPTDFNSIFSLI